jgi:hypothetical protein
MHIAEALQPEILHGGSPYKKGNHRCLAQDTMHFYHFYLKNQSNLRNGRLVLHVLREESVVLDAARPLRLHLLSRQMEELVHRVGRIVEDGVDL